MIITSRQNPLCKSVRALHAGKGRREHGLFLAEGRNAVEAAISSGWPVQRVLCTPQASEDWRDKLPPEISLIEVAREVLESISDAESAPEVLALCALPPVLSSSQLSPLSNLVLVLDGVSDPGNVGTLIRSADAAGASGVLLTSSSADAFAPKAVRASAGSVFHLPPLSLPDNAPHAIIEALRSRSTPVIIADARGETSCFDFAWPQQCALILGHETRGVSQEFQDMASARIQIPIYGKAESLNVAGAGAVLMYAWHNAAKTHEPPNNEL